MSSTNPTKFLPENRLNEAIKELQAQFREFKSDPTLGGSAVLSVSGTSNRITLSAGTGNVSVDISSSYVGQSSITTVGTIVTGTWSATTIAADKGGTGNSSYTKGDILAATGSTALSKLGVGSDGLNLQADSSQSTGLKYNGVGFIGKASDTGDRTTTSTSSATATAITNLSVSFTAVSGAIYRIRVGQNGYASVDDNIRVGIWEGSVAAGTLKKTQEVGTKKANSRVVLTSEYIGTLTAGAVTINVGIWTASGTMHFDGSSSESFLTVERLS